MTARIDKVVTRGVFSLDGQDFDVDNNVWLAGDHEGVLVIVAPYDTAPILEAGGADRAGNCSACGATVAALGCRG